MTYSVQTYEFTAFAESDFGVGNVGCGDTFTMPGDATVCFSVTDNDSTLSGDSCYNENSNDGSYQTASIIDAATGAELGNGGQIYGESYYWVHDQSGNWYVMIEIEQEGTGDDYFTFYTGGGYSVPPEGAELTVYSQCNISDWEPDFKCLGAGDKLELGTIKGTVWCDEDCDGIQDSSTTTTKGENLLKDGDFEAGCTIYNIGSYGAWYDAGNDSGDIIQGTQAYHNGNAADNEIWELDKGSVLCQVFEAPAAGKYCLTFDVYDNNCLGKYDDSFKVKINGQTVETVRVTADGTITIELDLAAGQNRLDFVSLSQVSGKGPGIDNIELRQEITETESEPVKEGVTVKLLDLDGNVIATTETDENGNYRFDDLPAGDYKIMGVAPDGTEFTIQDAGSDDSVDSDVDGNGMSGVISLGAGDTADIDLGVCEKETGSLSGRYFCDENRDDTENDGAGGFDVGVAGKTVSLFKADGTFVADTTTGSDGSYRFDDLEAGDYYVEFESSTAEGKDFVAPNVGTDTEDSDVIDPATGRSETVSVVAGEETKNLDAGVVEAPGSLSGRYFCDENGDGLDNDGADNAVAGIEVELLDAAGNGLGIFTTTGPDGTYSFGDLVPGTYGVRFTDPANLTDGKALTEANANGNTNDDIDSDAIGDAGTSVIEGIVVVAGRDTPDNDAGVVPLGSVAGRLFCDSDDDDLDNNNGDEDGVGGVTVTLTNVVTGEELTTETGPDGSYIFEDLAAGDYKVTFDGGDADLDGKVFVNQTPGDNDAIGGSDVDPTNGMTEVFTLGVGEDKTDVDAGVEPPDPGTGAIGDTIWLDLFGDGLLNDFEATIDGITVQLKDESGTVIATQVTSNGGQYLFDNLSAGTYSVAVVKPVIGDTVTFVNPDGSTETVTLDVEGIEGFELTAKDAGDDTLDSDFDPISMMSDPIVLGAGEVNLTIDGGLLRCGVIEGTSQADQFAPAGGYDLLVGCEGNDTMFGQSGEDTLLGNDGDDRIDGASFDDTLDGGAGNDDLTGGSENDILIGGLGDDEIDGGSENDIAVFSGNFADATINIVDIFTGELIVSGADGTDTVRNVETLRFDDGDVTVDSLVPGGSRDAVAAPLAGGSINIDVLANDIEISEGTLEVVEVNNGGFGTVVIEADGTVTYTAGSGFSGYDFFTYTVSNGLGFVRTVEVQVGELPNLNAGDPGVIALADVIGVDGVTFDGTGASESILGGVGYDTINARGGSDTVDGGKGDDRLTGASGNDLMLGGEGDDLIQSDGGDDQGFGQTGDDAVNGQFGNDFLFGGDGNDQLRGLEGSDFMSGGNGDDTFRLFRDGADIALGGAGADSFEWAESNGAERDFIDGESGIDSLEITLDAGADAVAVQAEIDAYLAQAAANTPSGGTVSDGSVLSDTFSFTTIDLDIRNIEDVFIA